MKIAIISDTHDNLANIDKFIAYAKKIRVSRLIHCGDIASGETLGHIARNFNGTIWAVLGNMDYRESVKSAAQKLKKQVILFEDIGKISAGEVNICFSHFKEKIEKICASQEFDFAFYGHTHKPWLENIGSCRVANPGNLAGLFFKPTFAVLDAKNKKLELKIIDALK